MKTSKENIIYILFFLLFLRKLFWCVPFVLGTKVENKMSVNSYLHLCRWCCVPFFYLCCPWKSVGKKIFVQRRPKKFYVSHLTAVHVSSICIWPIVYFTNWYFMVEFSYSYVFHTWISFELDKELFLQFNIFDFFVVFIFLGCIWYFHSISVQFRILCNSTSCFGLFTDLA